MIDLKQAVSAWLVGREQRASHGGLHVSDVCNECPRFLWHRLRSDGAQHKTYTAETYCKFEQGLAIEGVIRKALSESLAPLGWKAMPDLALAFDSQRGVWQIIPPEDAAGQPAHVVVGHPDIVFERASERHVVEVKSTMWFRQGFAPVKPPAIADIRTNNQNYILQGAAYAYAVGAEQFSVFVVDRGTGQFEEYVFNTAAEYPAYATRYKSIALVPTSQTEPEPDLPPWTVARNGNSYLCKTCPVVECKLHPMQGKMRDALNNTASTQEGYGIAP